MLTDIIRRLVNTFPTDGIHAWGGDLVSIMPVCVCLKVKEMDSFLSLQVNELNEKMSFKMGVKFAASFYMGKSFFRCMECIYTIEYQK